MNSTLAPDPAAEPILNAPRKRAAPARRIAPNAITLEAPLLSVEAARLALRCGEDDLMAWILSGDLEWAFDLRRAGSRRAHVRILTASVAARQRRHRRIMAREKAAQQLHPFQKVFDILFPPARPVLLSTGLALVWACGTSHIHNLVQDGLLTVVEKNYALREAFQIPRDQIFQFMQCRRIK